jgi:hypothetical protein
VNPSARRPDESAVSRSALVLYADALAAALLGALLETLGWDLLFAAPDESPRDALRRLRPTLVLADCGYEPAWVDTFLGPARMLGVPVMVFGDSSSAESVRRLATRHRLVSIILPTDPAILERCVHEALTPER